MLAAPLLDSSCADEGPQFSVGEIVNGEYRVRSVEADKQGRVIHKCSRLSNGESVVVLNEGRNGQLGAWPSYQSSPAMPATSGMHPAGRFEVQIGSDMFAYVVYAERVLKDTYGQQEADFERAKPVQQRPQPFGTLCVVHRRGDCQLEVDIPANGCNCVGTFFMGFCVLFIAAPCIFASTAVPSAFTFSPALGTMTLVFLLLLILGAGFVVKIIIGAVFGHENLTITPEEFSIKRKLEWKPTQRDSVNNEDAAAEELTCLDRILCKQTSGNSRNLWKAEMKIRVHGDSDSSRTSTRRYLVLMEGVKEHSLGEFLSDAEKDWLMQEINEVLENIKRSASGV